MKMLSYNITGLGSRAKCKEVKDLIKGQGIEFCCIHGTKKELIDEFVCRVVWGEGNFGWSYREPIGRSGGILSVWNADVFKVRSA